jgi:ribonuclease R
MRVIKAAEDLAGRIRKRRVRDGMLSLVLPEVEIALDRDGRVESARPADTSFSHTIIEMFMVEANEAVARRLRKAGLGFLRRIHPPPTADDTRNLEALGPILGTPPPARLTREAMHKLLDAARGRPEERAVSYLLLRSMSQASYSPSEEEHFALASDDYCHFTSPIRRYPDLTVHRLVDIVLRGAPPSRGRQAKQPPEILSDAELAELGRETTAAERRAQQAERDAERALLVMLARRVLGQVFDGVVTGVLSFGVFVQLDPLMIEGIVRVGDFGPDEWWYDKQTATFFGRGTGRLVHVGQPLRVLVAAADTIQQQVTLVPADGGPIGRPWSLGRPEVRRAKRGADRGRRGGRGRSGGRR